MRFCTKSKSQRHSDGLKRGVYDHTPGAAEFTRHCELDRFAVSIKSDVEIVIRILHGESRKIHSDCFSPMRVPIVCCHSLSIISVPTDFVRKVASAEHRVVV